MSPISVFRNFWAPFIWENSEQEKVYASYAPTLACPQKHSIFYRGSYMSAHVLLNLLNELGKRDKMRGLPSILSLSQRI